jgi:hypothetical protein
LWLAVAAEIHCTVGSMNKPRQMIIIERHPMRAIEPPKAALGEYDRTIEFLKPFDNPLRNFDIGSDLQVKIRDTRLAGTSKMLGVLDRHKNGGFAHLPQCIINIGLGAKRVGYGHYISRQAKLGIFPRQAPRWAASVRVGQNFDAPMMLFWLYEPERA